MNRSTLGIVVGAVLGLLDGLSAWFYPDARPMMLAIVVGSTIKGVLTGLAVGLVAQWRKSLPLGIAVGVIVGFALSTLAAAAQPDHYWAIVLPGMLVGAVAAVATNFMRPATMVAIGLCLLPAVRLEARQQPVGGQEPLAALDPLVGRRADPGLPFCSRQESQRLPAARTQPDGRAA